VAESRTTEPEVTTPISRPATAALIAALLTTYIGGACSGGAQGQVVTPMSVDAGPGSAEPRLSSGADGTIVLSWLEPGKDATLLRYSRFGASGWDPPVTVARGGDWFVNWADFPSVVPISGGLWAAHWLRQQPDSFYAYDVVIALSQDGGTTWGEPIVPHRDATATEHGFVSLFPWQGGVGAAWLDGRNTHVESSHEDHGEAGGMTLRSAVISVDGQIEMEAEMDGLVCDCCQTDVALAREGPVAVYRNRTEQEIRDIYVARSAGGLWQEGKPVADDHWEIAGCPVNGPAIAASGDEVAVAWFTMAGEVPRVRFARSTDGARSFAPALDLASGTPEGRVDVVFLEDRRIAVSWLDRGEGQQGEIKVRVMSPDGTPAQLYVIAETEVTRPAGFPQLAADGDSLIVAWTDAAGEETRVQTARIDL
jgi:hypothetical protein